MHDHHEISKDKLSESELVEQHIIQLCRFIDGGSTNINNEVGDARGAQQGCRNLYDEEDNSDNSEKFLTGYSFCALETKKFFLTNGISVEILANLPSYKFRNVTSKFQDNDKIRFSNPRRETLEPLRDVLDNTSNNNNNADLKYRKAGHCKQEIMEKIREKIFERKRQKMANLRRQRENVQMDPDDW